MFTNFPNRKKKLITKEFLQHFKKEIDNQLINRNTEDCDKSYLGIYGDTYFGYDFYIALKLTCDKFNLTKAIYDYMYKMPWYNSDIAEDKLILMMVEYNIIPYTTGKESLLQDYDDSEIFPNRYKLVKHYKGYDVVEYDSWDNDKKYLENIYKDVYNIEIIWL